MTTRLVRTPLIPDRVTIARIAARHELHYEAICAFAATGFFLEADGYYRDEHALQPACEYEIDSDGVIVRSKRYWSWHHSPRPVPLEQAADELAEVLELSVAERDGTAILALSGGLDSRTLAAALAGHTVHAYGYGFASETIETEIAGQVASAQRFAFEPLAIPRGYLWSAIDDLAAINRCQSEFTHPRQMAVLDRIAALGEYFVLGHWGDVLFDDFGVQQSASLAEITDKALAKIVKRGGAELGRALWTAWGLSGDFDSYLRDRVQSLLAAIDISEPNARLRAFKSLYWAPRWTTVNLGVFQSRRPCVLPYYSDDMCKLVCTLPSELLDGRKVQIEYLKRRAPALARVPWQSYYPLDLYSFGSFHSVRRMPGRVARRVERLVRETVAGHAPVTRNWELQFVGDDNDARLYWHLFAHGAFRDLVPRQLVMDFYRKFQLDDRVTYSHPLSMLLTLSMFARREVGEARLRNDPARATVGPS